jgi:PiT family inorganic phosphate transporter
MTTITDADGPSGRPDLDKGLGVAGKLGMGAAILVALMYVAYSVYSDAASAGVAMQTFLPFILLFIALLIALGFEFVNGFHDTANAVATVIYTHSLPPTSRWCGRASSTSWACWLSSGAVAFGIIALLPVELIMQVGSGAGFAMVFALLIAAIIWNLGTWWLGLPASSRTR